jgi:hypothetical protein
MELEQRYGPEEHPLNALRLGSGMAACVMSPASERVSSSRRVSCSHSPTEAIGMFLIGPPVALCCVRGGWTDSSTWTRTSCSSLLASPLFASWLSSALSVGWALQGSGKSSDAIGVSVQEVSGGRVLARSWRVV